MWKVGLVFVFHRLILFVAALVSLNQNPLGSDSPKVVTKFEPYHQLQSRFIEKISEGEEIQELERLRGTPLKSVFQRTRNPFLWMGHLIQTVTRLPGPLVAILLSNLFLLLFLWELIALIGRMTTSDIAVNTAILAVLWPTSYELSLGATLAMTCLFSTLAVRHALDDRWLLGGLATGALAFVEPLAVGLLPLLLYFFWYFHRQYPATEMAKRLAFFLVPVVIAIGIQWRVYAELGMVLRNSALVSLMTGFQSGNQYSWAFSKAFAGQTITAIIFIGGGAGALLVNSTLLHRLIPLYFCALLFVFSPYGSIASRALIAASCLEGLAAISARPVLRAVQLMLLTLGAYEVYFTFAGMAPV